MQLLDGCLHRAIQLFVFRFILKFVEWVLSNFLLNRLISDSIFIGAVFCLKNSFCSRNINVLTVLWIRSHNEFLNALWTFHTELVNFGSVKIIHPCLYSIKSHTFCDHVLTAFATNMKWCLISDFTTSNSFSFDNFEGFLMRSLTFLGKNILRIVIFRNVEVISSSCCQ